MAQITLKILGNNTDALQKIADIKTEIGKIESNPIKIKVDSSGVEAAGEASKTAAASQEKFNAVQVKTAESASTAQRAQTQAATAIRKTGDAAQQASKHTESLLDNMAKFARWWAVGGVVTSITRSLSEALDTLKAVDDELVAVRKVTGFSDAQIQSIKNQAFEIASAYGEAADAYLEGVAAFSRAGYREQSAALAELSTKTQIVGDTNADVANQFLLSVDAAYKYKGSIEALSAVLDGANEIDNRYATSISKIAEGLGIVAPVAAQLGVGIDELTAMIGTITAVTQRSGAEASRALRSVLINLTSDINATFTDVNGEITYAIGEIDGLRDVVQLYAKDLYDSAKATGKILNPTEVLEALVRAAEEGRLTEQKLYDLVTDESGKLRAAQLWALIQNWDTMYKSMLQDYAGAIGSADKEVENALDSWTRKTNILKNTWAEFISGFVDTDLVKDALDVITNAIEALDTGLGKVVISGVAVGAILTMIATHPVGAAIAAGTTAVVLLLSAIGDLKAKQDEYNETLRETYPELYNLKDAVDAFNESQEQSGEEYNQSAAEAEAAAARAKVYIEMLGEVGEGTDEYRAILSNLVELYPELSGYIDEETGLLNIQGQELVDLIDKWREYALQRAAVEKYTELFKQKLALEQAYEAAKIEAQAAHQQLDAIASQMSAIQRQFEATAYWKSGGADYSDYEEYNRLISEFVELRDDEIRGYNVLTQKVGEYDDSLRDAEDALEATNTEIDSLDATIRGQATAAATATKANDEYANSAGNAQGEAQTLAELMKQVEDGLNEEADAATNAAMQTQFYALQAALASGQPIDTASAITSLSGLSAQSTNTAAALQALIAVFQQIESMDAQISSYTDKAASATGRRGQLYASRLATLTEQRTNFDVAGAFQRAYAEALANMPGETSGGGGGGGSSSQTDEMLENYKQIVSLEEQRLSFLRASGASVEEQVEQVKAIQSAMHDEADYLRSIGGDEEDILKLSTEWWKYQDKISDLLKETDNDLDDVVKYYQQQLSLLQESGASNEQIEAKMREIMAVLEQQILALQQTDAYLKGDLATLTQIAQIQTQIAQYQNKINDLYKEETETTQKQEDVLGDIVKLRKNELSYLEESGASTDQIAAKMREIQTALLAQISALKQTDEYLSGNAATMAEIVSLQTQWMQYQNKIKDLYQQELQKAVEKVRDGVLELIDVQEEAAVGPLQKQLDILEAQKKTVEDTRTEEERLLAVEKARVALQNAQNERNIRQYNAQTGQWEWVANAETVSKAQSALEDAEKALADYYTEREISMLKDQISSLETEYDALRDAVSDFAQGVIDGTESYKDAAAYLNTAVYGMSDTVKATAAQAAEAFSGLGDAVRAAAAAAAATMMSGAKAFAAAATAAATSAATATGSEYNRKVSQKGPYEGDYETIVRDYMSYATMDSPYANSYATRSDLYVAKAKSTAAGRSAEDVMAWLDAGMRTGAVSEQEAIDALREITGRSGIQGNKEKYNVLMDALEDLEGGDYQRKWNNSVYDEDDKRYSWRYVKYDSGGILPGRKVFRGKKSIAPDPHVAELHGSGGLLRGIGGIKATTEDEMVLPPEMTKGLLTAQNSGAFDALLGSLGIVTAAAESVAGIGGGVTRNSIGSQHNGDVYELGSISLSESQARGMTVYDLAQMARGLSLRNA